MVKRSRYTSPDSTRKRSATSASSNSSTASHPLIEAERDSSSDETGLISSSSMSTPKDTPNARTPTSSQDEHKASEDPKSSSHPSLHSRRPSGTETIEHNGNAATKTSPIMVSPSAVTALDIHVSQSREPSHDGTVILPDVIRRAQSLGLRASIPFHGSDSFPLFRSGDVVVSTQLGSTPKTFQLHSAVLAHHSPWFQKSLQGPDAASVHTKWYRYELTELDDSVKLVRQEADGDCPVHHLAESDNIPGVSIKVEEMEYEFIPRSTSSASPASEETTRIRHRPSNMAVVAYWTRVLGAFYSIPPQISTTDVGTAFVEAEELVNIANSLECLYLLRPHLSNTFSQYRQQLWTAVKADPPRWMKLAIALQDASIFTECLIHLVGAHPNWPWPTKRAIFTPELRQLVANKSKTLDHQCTEADRELLMVTIKVGRDATPVSCDDRAQLETWMTVQVFRDAVATGFYSMEKGNKQALKRGSMYRRLHKGGSAYMELEEVKARCLGIMQSGWKELGEDLKSLKCYASTIVEELAENQLMIADPDSQGIGYLTCAKVQPEDIPW